ncbi:MAG: hypothetical protein ACI9E1_001905 [Cryomorphaceae bacterium]|jgi:hypothetical protein
MKNILFAGLVAGSLLFTSCGDKKADTGVEKGNLKANEAVDNWAKDASDGRVASLWDSLPASYQSEISGSVHSVGDKIDADVYNEAMKTMSAATALLKSKKSMILEMAKEQGLKSEMDKVDDVSASYDSIVGLINAIATSDAKDVDGLKKLDMAKFLGDIQEHTKSLMELAALAPGGEENMAKLKAATATLLSESGDSAEVEMTVDGSTKKVTLVKKEDRWMPEDMVKDWPDMMKSAKEAIGEMADMQPVEKEKVLSVLRMAQAAIKELEGANTKEEMQKKMEEFMGGI